MTLSSGTASRRGFLIAGLGTAVGACAPPPSGMGTPLAAEAGAKPAKGQSSPRVKGQKVEAWSLCYLFVGEKGMMAASPQRYVLLPEDRFAGYQPPAKSIPDSIGHWAEWVAACKTGSPTGCHFGYAGPMTEIVLLGNVAFRAGRRLEWDGPNLKVTNCPEAQQFVRRDYRSGWTL